MKKVKIFIFIALAALFFTSREDVAMAKAKEIQLPQPAIKGKISLEEAIVKRRSWRSFRPEELSMTEMGQLFWAAQGVTEKRGSYSFRAAPSAGALYPIEIYALTKDRVYHYLPWKHAVEVLRENDLRNDLARAALGQSAVSQAPLDIVICAVYERTISKYGERGVRYVYMEAGHVAQNIQLMAVCLGLGSVPVGAFDDHKVKALLNLDKNTEPLYIIPVGVEEKQQ